LLVFHILSSVFPSPRLIYQTHPSRWSTHPPPTPTNLSERTYGLSFADFPPFPNHLFSSFLLATPPSIRIFPHGLFLLTLPRASSGYFSLDPHAHLFVQVTQVSDDPSAGLSDHNLYGSFCFFLSHNNDPNPPDEDFFHSHKMILSERPSVASVLQRCSGTFRSSMSRALLTSPWRSSPPDTGALELCHLTYLKRFFFFFFFIFYTGRRSIFAASLVK